MGSEVSPFIKQWYETETPVPIVHSGSTMVGDDFIKEHQKEMEGVIFDNRYWPGPISPNTVPFLDAYKKKHDRDATSFAAQSYDAMNMMLTAIQNAGSTDKVKIKDALEKVEIVGVLGDRRFTSVEEGHMSPYTTVMVQIQNGKKVPIWPLGLASGEGSTFQSIPPFPWE
jgi:branched-chain amino acid transport system substrate-binding protein